MAYLLGAGIIMILIEYRMEKGKREEQMKREEGVVSTRRELRCRC
jgi:hypothetical protein